VSGSRESPDCNDGGPRASWLDGGMSDAETNDIKIDLAVKWQDTELLDARTRPAELAAFRSELTEAIVNINKLLG